jgi:WD40 repeat protein
MDKTVVVWRAGGGAAAQLATLSGHVRAVADLAWSPLMPASLASAAFDATVRRWSLEPLACEKTQYVLRFVNIVVELCVVFAFL